MSVLDYGYILRLNDGRYRTNSPWNTRAGKTNDIKKAKVYKSLGVLRGAMTYHSITDATAIEVKLTILQEFPARNG